MHMVKVWINKIEVNKIFKNFTLLFIGAVIIYAQLMVNQLTNDYDGLWENSFHNAGEWEISLGRWFWQYISRLRFGTSSDPYTTLITLALIVIGLLIVFDLWKITDKAIMVLSGLLFISHSTICFELSYRYMSPTFGVAFVLSVLSVWCFEKIDNAVVSILIGALCVAFSMGSYQAYICCTTVAFLTTILIKLSKNVKWKRILIFAGKSVSGIILGGIQYIVILNMYLNKNGLSMSGYQGGNKYSVINSILCLPESIRKTYEYFSLYFKGILYKINRMQGKHIFTVMFILILIMAVFNIISIFKQNKFKAVLFGLLILLYPIFTLSIMLIATDTTVALQMACGPALFLTAMPCLFCSRENCCANKENEKTRWYTLEKCRGIVSVTFSLFMAAVLYGSIYQVIIDQNTMYEGRVATENMADLVVDKLLQEDMLNSDYRYLFLGTPCSSPLYGISSNYVNANFYAQYGAWYVGENSAKSWRGVIRSLKGLNLNVITGAEYNALASSEMVANMSQFPNSGSVLLKDNIVYIKIGNSY